MKHRTPPAASPRGALPRMDHFGWLADELTDLWEQLETQDLKGDAAEVQKLLMQAIEAANLASRARRKRAGAAPAEAVVARPAGPPSPRRLSNVAARRKRNRPEVAPGPVPFALGFA